MIRVQKKFILKDLDKKMVFLVGPRQSGKTWLAKDVASHFPHSVYLNFDNMKDREIIQRQAWVRDTDLLVLDELHKMKDWKNYLKGIFDTKPSSMRLLVTGSARLDVYDQVGDSLAGRYFRHRLMPFSMAEIEQTEGNADIDKLLERGGFPEPYLSEVDVDAKRWRQQYIHSLLSTDVFEVDTIHNLKGMRLVFELLRHRVGSPVSYQSLSEDVGVSPSTVKKYIAILESIYVVFRVTPYSKNITRSLLKEPKIYFFDTALVEGEGQRLENLVALSLLKDIYVRTDVNAEDLSLHYLRTKEGDEVDFAVANHHQIEQIIEVKNSDDQISKSLRKFHQRYGFPARQLVRSMNYEYQDGDIEVRKAENFLKQLFL